MVVSSEKKYLKISALHVWVRISGNNETNTMNRVRRSEKPCLTATVPILSKLIEIIFTIYRVLRVVSFLYK